MSKMKIESFCVGQVQTNCYLAVNEETGEALAIDPGDDAQGLYGHICEKNYSLCAILLTHGHFDHAMAAEELSQLSQAKIYAHEEERGTLEDPRLNLSGMIGRGDAYHADVYLKDEETLKLAGFSIRALHTPGHTRGGCCYYIPMEDVVFSGDTLFCQSIGRTDFPGGSMSQLVRSIREKLMALPERTVVYPGHMEETTIEQERQWNPYL